MKMRFCSNCGHKIPADSKFCPICGATLKPMPSDVNQPEPSANTQAPKATVQKAPVKKSSGQNSIFATLVSWVDIIVNVFVLGKLYHDYELGQHYRPFHQNQPDHPIMNWFAQKGNDVSQYAGSVFSPAYIAHQFLPYIVILAIVSGVLFFVFRKKQNKFLSGCLIVMAVVLIIVALALVGISNQ